MDVFIFIAFSIEMSVSYQCRSRPDATFGSVSNGSALFHYTQKKGLIDVQHGWTVLLGLSGIMCRP